MAEEENCVTNYISAPIPFWCQTSWVWECKNHDMYGWGDGDAARFKADETGDCWSGRQFNWLHNIYIFFVLRYTYSVFWNIVTCFCFWSFLFLGEKRFWLLRRLASKICLPAIQPSSPQSSQPVPDKVVVIGWHTRCTSRMFSVCGVFAATFVIFPMERGSRCISKPHFFWRWKLTPIEPLMTRLTSMSKHPFK